MYLSKRGYVIKKDSLKDQELNDLKKILVAKPLTDNKFFVNENSYPIYIETKTKIYIPKMFGIQKFGFPKTLDNSIDEDLVSVKNNKKNNKKKLKK